MSASRRRSIRSPGKPGMSTKRPPPVRARTPRTRPALARSWLLQLAVPLVRFSQPKSMSTVSVVARSRAAAAADGLAAAVARDETVGAVAAVE